jgi:dihydroneopterin aldolase
MPQRRIDLLAIEQEAWCLAARDPRCVVVETRTELDWAMRHDGISVWAPSKLVLDAVHGPGAQVTAPLALAHWLAGAFDARAVLEIGPARDPLPEGSQPVQPRIAIPTGAIPPVNWLKTSA